MLLIFLTFLSFPFLADSCLETPTKCPCPAVRYIDQIGIANLEYGSYLANRTTTRPRVTVTDECQIVADVSELDTQNHYLMVFREGAPPIFAKRLANDTDKIIQLSDITCTKVEDKYHWKYYNGTFDDLSLAVQSNEEWCSCNASFFQFDAEDNLTNPTCDKFSFVAKKLQNWPTRAALKTFILGRMPTYLSISTTNSVVVDDLMCVNEQWYYNNYVLPTRTRFSVTLDEIPFCCGCSAVDFYTYEYTLDSNGAYANYTIRNVVSSYNEDTCSVELKCSNPNDTLAIYSYSYKTLSYPPGTKPSISCASSPLSSSSDSPKFWYVDGVMVNDPRTACYSDSCPCSFAFLDGTYFENYIRNHPSLDNITSLYSFKNTMARGIFMMTDNACPEKLDFSSRGIIIFDKTTATVFDKNELTANCSSTTKRWTVEGQEFEQLYAIGYSYE